MVDQPPGGAGRVLVAAVPPRMAPRRPRVGTASLRWRPPQAVNLGYRPAGRRPPPCLRCRASQRVDLRIADDSLRERRLVPGGEPGRGRAAADSRRRRGFRPVGRGCKPWVIAASEYCQRPGGQEPERVLAATTADDATAMLACRRCHHRRQAYQADRQDGVAARRSTWNARTGWTWGLTRRRPNSSW